ncbi:ribonuclease P protein component [Patescibacteria group bacterium]
MLAKTNRLKPDWAVTKVRRRGKRVKTGLFHLFYLSRKRGQSVRFAFVVPLRVSKKAVLRNKLRRRAREAVKPIIAELKPGTDVLISFSPRSLPKSVKDLQDAFLKTFIKSHLLRK